ncbi:ABC transporter permease [Subtercola sp. YIM 133946]|uniref:ABC transporter permease n=1 Tax=Subtercola sp. YIM 133946 TaxID=3118909 RepID=UPI002F9411D6
MTSTVTHRPARDAATTAPNASVTAAGQMPPSTTAGGTRRRLGLLLGRVALEVWLPVVLVGVWWFASANSTSPFFPPLQKILAKTWQVWVVQGRVSSDLLPSILNLLAGYGIAVIVGVAAGLALGLLPRLLDAVEPELEFLRAVPAVAILPIAIIAIGLGDDMRIAVIAFGALWPILVNTVAGVRSTDPVVRDVSTAFRLKPAIALFSVRLPSAAPQILAGARTALSIAVVLIVVSEMSGAYRGIGNFVLAAQRNYAITDMWTGMIVLGLLGYALNLVFRVVEARLLAWHPAYRKKGVK